MAYLLDTNVFIQAKNLQYGFDFCPAFWDWLQRMNAQGKVFSIQQVGDELQAGEDELATWGAAQGDAFFLPPDNAVLAAAPRLSAWAAGQDYAPVAVNTFLQVADYWLVAFAAAYQHIVVTHEVPANTPKKIKIPNACVGLGVRFMTPYQMLRTERARFVLGPATPEAAL
jgi:predicted nucleic acid-binding protein